MDLRQLAANAFATPPSPPALPSSGYIVGGDPGTARPASVPGPYWFHQIAEELRHLLVLAGVTPAPGDLTQLRQALDARYATFAVLQDPPPPSGPPSPPWGLRLGSFVLQWVRVPLSGVSIGAPGVAATAAFPLAFDNACLVCWTALEPTIAGDVFDWTVSITSRSTTSAGIKVQADSGSAGTVLVFALGH